MGWYWLILWFPIHLFVAVGYAMESKDTWDAKLFMGLFWPFAAFLLIFGEVIPSWLEKHFG